MKLSSSSKRSWPHPACICFIPSFDFTGPLAEWEGLLSSNIDPQVGLPRRCSAKAARPVASGLLLGDGVQEVGEPNANLLPATDGTD